MQFLFRVVLALSFLICGLGGQESTLWSRHDPTSHTGVPWSGVLEDASGVAVSGAILHLYTQDHTLLGNVTSAGDGRFEFDSVPSGPCMLEVNVPGHQQVSLSLFVDGPKQMLALRLPPEQDPPKARPAPAPATVSVSELENDRDAPPKARHDLSKAGEAMRKHDWAKAVRMTDAAIEAGPRWARAYLLRGVLYLQNRMYPQAERDLVTATRINPQGAQAYAVLGALSLNTHQPAQAELYLNQALRNNADLWQGYFELGRLRLQQQRFQDVVRLASQALHANPPGALDCYLLRASGYHGLNQNQAAAADLKTFLQQAKPDDPGRPVAEKALLQLAEK